MPTAGPNCKDVIFADDVTQIIANYTNNRDELADDTMREITRINIYEKKWKIKTNVSKFNIISISKSRPLPIYVENRLIPFKNESTILGLKIKRTGIISHITARIRAAKAQTQKLKRFAKLEVKTKLHLYKAPVRPVLEYPIIPNALTSKTQQRKMQMVQNRNIRMIKKGSELEQKTIKETHEHLQLEPINTRLFAAAEKLWHKMQEKETILYNQSMAENLNNIRDHNWWPRAVKVIDNGMPEPYCS